MSLSAEEQFKKILENSREVLILIEENPSADAVGSGWGLYHILEKMNLRPTLAFSNHLAEKFRFLPQPERMEREISGARDLVLSFDTSRNKIISARSEEKDGHFNIFVTPEKGAIDPRDFSFILAKFKYDLVIVINCLDLEKLGKIYFENPDLFYEVPLVNLDHRSENDGFGQISLIDILASSSAEIIYRLFKDWKPDLIDQKIATCLLTGIIGSTESFQKKNTTPKSLEIAAELMEQKADQQEIVRWLYKTQPLRILKLWGKIMAKINWDKNLNTAWSEISLEDFVQSRATPEDVFSAMERLKENYSEGKIFLVIFADTPKTCLAIAAFKDRETEKQIAPQLKGILRNRFWEIKIETGNLSEASRIILSRLREISGTRLA